MRRRAGFSRSYRVGVITIVPKIGLASDGVCGGHIGSN